MSRPLQNRVAPDGTLCAVTSRGGLLGNRGGRIHDQMRKIVRKWASKQWICCVLEFKNRQREVMGNSYTELFFLDEATAFAAGHRPCFECRRKDAVRFATIWAEASGQTDRARAPDMDKVLHTERLSAREHLDIRQLPPGAMFQLGDEVFLKQDNGVRPWSFEGYGPQVQMKGTVTALTCRSMRTVLANGYEPQLHPSAAG